MADKKSEIKKESKKKPIKYTEPKTTQGGDKIIFFSVTLVFSTIISSVALALSSVSRGPYFLKIILPFVLGLLTIVFIKMSTNKARLRLFASSFVAAMASVSVFILTKIAYIVNQKVDLAQVGSKATESQAALIGMFGETHPIIDTFAVFILFVIPTLFFLIKKDKADWKETKKIAVGLGVVIVLISILNFVINYITKNLIVIK